MQLLVHPTRGRLGIAILIAARDGQHARAQDIGDTVGDETWIARIGNQSGEPCRNAERLFNRPDKHDPAVGRQPPAIKRSRDFLAPHGW